MKSLLLVLASLLVALAFAAPAATFTVSGELAPIATTIARQQVTVRCYAHGEDGDPYTGYGAWGYVYPVEPVEYLAAEVCAGALGIRTDSAPRWEQALGALVLSHESFHLALRFRNRTNEARTECRAVKHVAETMVALGASPERVAELLPFALAIHYHLTSVAPEYNLPGCKVPWPYWGDGS